MRPLPIDDVLPELLSTLQAHGQLVLQAPPGAGKSTRVPPAVLDAMPAALKVLMLEPRRVAARAVAARIAQERGVRLGAEVGYSVRFDRKVSASTRLEVVTEGMLLRRLHEDPLLSDVGCVILDEFHERSVLADLAIAMLKEVRMVREDLWLVVMSATLQTEQVCAYLDGAPCVVSPGRVFPVAISYREPSRSLVADVSACVREVMSAPQEQDALVFLPGARSIMECAQALGGQDFEVFALYGALSLGEQLRAITSDPSRRRVILATNIAETSLTVEGVTSVIDSGRVKQMSVELSSGMNRLEEVAIALDSAEQRAGRAGRVRPGRAIRLWTQAEEQFMKLATQAEIHRVDLSPVVLEVLRWSSADPLEFDWFEAPPVAAIQVAVDLLRRLGALQEQGFSLTPTGHVLASMPAHPRQGRMLLEGSALGVRREVATAAAILSEGDFVGRPGRAQALAACDLWQRVGIFDEVARGRMHGARGLGLSADEGVARRLMAVRDQLERAAAGHEVARSDFEQPQDEARFRRAILAGYPDRVCLRREREGAERDYVMVGGEPMTLSFESALSGDEAVLVATRVSGERRARDGSGVQSRGLIRLASEVELAWVERAYPERFVEEVELGFDAERERVVAMKVRRFEGLLLSSEVVSVKDHASREEVAAILAQAVSPDIERAFRASKDDVQLLARLECLREWMPELELPDLRAQLPEGEQREASGQAILEQWCWGKRGVSELRRASVEKLVRSALRHDQWSALNEYAPARMQVPSGSGIRVEYAAGEEPVLAVRIQEVFGWVQTPRIARGKIALTLHLLAPNYRPAQVTKDLESFWRNTYPQVRKELRARYAKHAWPEDPWSAQPERKGRSHKG